MAAIVAMVTKKKSWLGPDWYDVGKLIYDL